MASEQFFFSCGALPLSDWPIPCNSTSWGNIFEPKQSHKAALVAGLEGRQFQPFPQVAGKLQWPLQTHTGSGGSALVMFNVFVYLSFCFVCFSAREKPLKGLFYPLIKLQGSLFQVGHTASSMGRLFPEVSQEYSRVNLWGSLHGDLEDRTRKKCQGYHTAQESTPYCFPPEVEVASLSL